MSSPTQRSLTIVGLVAVVAIALSVLLGTTVGKTTTSTAPSAPSAASTAAATAATCQQVAADLADGPDPDTDPVGYALAQIKPLAAIKSTDHALERAVQNLDQAYAQFYNVLGADNSKALITVAGKDLDKFCPGLTD